MARRPPRGKAASLLANERTVVVRTPGPSKKPPPVHIPTAKKVPLPASLAPSPIVPPRRAAPAPASGQAPLRTLRQPPSLEPRGPAPKTRSSYAPLFPGQKPSRYETRFAPLPLLSSGKKPPPIKSGPHKVKVPVYDLGKAGPVGDEAAQMNSAELAQAAAYRQKELGTPGVILRDVATSLVPKTFSDVANGRKVRGGQVLRDVGNAALNFVEPVKGATLAGAIVLRGSRSARLFTQAVREEGVAAAAVKAAKIAEDARYTPALAKTRKEIQPLLDASENRQAIHAEIDAQLPRAKAAKVKANLDHAAVEYAASEAKKIREGGVAERRAHVATDYYDMLAAEAAGETMRVARYGVRIDPVALEQTAKGLYQSVKNSKVALPPGVKNARDMEGLLDHWVKLAKEGEPGRYWYEESGAEILKAVGGDPEKVDRWLAGVKAGNRDDSLLRAAGGNLEAADRIVQAVAWLSRVDAVQNNVGHALKAWKNFTILGDAGRAGRYPEKNNPVLNAIFGGEPWSGRKTNSFYRNLIEHVDPSRHDLLYGDSPATIDRWMVRAAGFEDDQVDNPARYELLEQAVKHVADQLGWTPKQVQAAIWVAAKARHEGSTVGEAARSFADYLGSTWYATRLNFEAAPGSTWGGLPEYWTWDRPTQMAYADQKAKLASDYLAEVGMPHRVADPGTGVYTNPAGKLETNPAVAIELHVGVDREAAKAGLAPEERAFYDGVVAGMGKAFHQNAMPWLRPIRYSARSQSPATKPELTAYKVALGRQMTEQEAVQASKLLEGTNVGVAHADGGAYVFKLWSEADGWDTLVAENKDFQKRAASVIDEVFGPDTEAQGFRHEGGYVENDWKKGASDYEGIIAASGRPDLLGPAADALARRSDQVDAAFRADPAGAAGRAEAVAPTPAPLDVSVLDQTFDPGMVAAEARSDASSQSWLDGVKAQLASDRGEVSLDQVLPRAKGLDTPYRSRTLTTGSLDVQLPRARSSITQAGERLVDEASKALDETFVKDYPLVRLMTSTERASKAAGRAQRQNAVRRLSRMADETHALAEVKEGTPNDVAQFWYAQLPASHRNAEGLQLIRDKQAEELQHIASGEAAAALDRRESALKAALGDAEQGEQWPILRELADVKTLRDDHPFRIQDITASLAQLDTLIANAPPVNQRVLDAMGSLAADRQRILEEGGRLKADRAEARPQLVADWLGLDPDGTEVYVGHRLPRPEAFKGSFAPSSGGTGRVGSPAGTASRNMLVLARNGRLRQSTRVSFEDWQQAQVFQQAIDARHDLGRMGEPWSGGNLPAGHVLVNPKGKTIPAHWRTDELSQFPEDTVDRDEIRALAKDVLSGFMAEHPDDVQELARLAVEAGQPISDLRVVPKRQVDRYYSQFRSFKGQSSATKAYDMAIDGVATSIIFFRVGYIPKNVVQNLIMAVPHQGAFLLPNAVRSGQVLNDPLLRHLIKGEVHGSAATAALGQEATTKKALSRVTNFVTSVADDPVRVAAFLHEAAAEGVIPRTKILLGPSDREALIKLLTDPRQERRLNDVRQRAVDAMADFSRMTPDQARLARRFLVIPGWLVAGSRYPFHFAATHPIRSALLAYAAMGEPGAPEELQFNSPITDYLSGSRYLRGFDTRWGRERTSSLNPVSMPWDLAQGAVGSIRGKTSPFDYQTETAFDYANPLLKNVVGIAQGDESVKQGLTALAPNYQLIRGLIHPVATAHYPEDATRLGRLKREVGIAPIKVVDSPPRKKTHRAKRKMQGPPGSSSGGGSGQRTMSQP